MPECTGTKREIERERVSRVASSRVFYMPRTIYLCEMCVRLSYELISVISFSSVSHYDHRVTGLTTIFCAWPGPPSRPVCTSVCALCFVYVKSVKPISAITWQWPQMPFPPFLHSRYYTRYYPLQPATADHVKYLTRFSVILYANPGPSLHGSMLQHTQGGGWWMSVAVGSSRSEWVLVDGVSCTRRGGPFYISHSVTRKKAQFAF